MTSASLSTGDRKRLEDLCASLRAAFGADLVAVGLYGSAARGDHDAASDLNVVVVVTDLSLASLERATTVTRSWEAGRNRPLLFFSPEWIARSCDVFPLEFSDIRQWHVILDGSDPFAAIEVSPEALRAQCESELKTKLILLRTGYMDHHQDEAALARVLAGSHAPMTAICRGILRLAGQEPPAGAGEAAARAGAICGFDPAPFLAVAAVRLKGPKGAASGVKPLYRAYYAEIEKMARAVDGGLTTHARKGAGR